MFEYNNLSKNEIGDNHLDNLLMDIKENENECFILTNEIWEKKIDYEKIELMKGQQLPSGEVIIVIFKYNNGQSIKFIFLYFSEKSFFWEEHRHTIMLNILRA